MLNDELIAKLRSVDTPTICNALEEVAGRRHNSGFTRSPVVTATPTLPPMLGFARTALLRASEPAHEPAAIVKERRMAYYRHIVSGPGPNVAVIQDIDDVPGVGAFWGEVNVAIHKGLGVAGAITNGAIRDLGMLDPDFFLLGGMVTPSHAFANVTALDVTATVFGLTIRPNDLLHADRHGVVIIPPDALSELPRAIDLVIRKEAPILAAARAEGFTVDRLIEAWGVADDVH